MSDPRLSGVSGADTWGAEGTVPSKVLSGGDGVAYIPKKFRNV